MTGCTTSLSGVCFSVAPYPSPQFNGKGFETQLPISGDPAQGWEAYVITKSQQVGVKSILHKAWLPNQDAVMTQIIPPVLPPFFDSVDAPHIPPPLVIPG